MPPTVASDDGMQAGDMAGDAIAHGERAADEAFPALFRAADAASVHGQRWFKRLSGVELACIVVGAGAAWILAVAGRPEREIAIAAGGAFLLALLARLMAGARRDDQAWFDGRALAETVKSQTWQYLMRVPPFEHDETADRTLVQHLRSAMRVRVSLSQDVDAAEPTAQITPWMRMSRNLGLADRRDLYLRRRLHDQVQWYRRSAQRNQRAARRWSALATGAEGAAIVVAIAAATSEPIARLGIFGLFGSLAAVFTALNQLGRHAESARAYSLAYHELLTIASLAESVQTEEELVTVVRDGEGAISREHTMWMAKRAEPLELTSTER